MNIPQRELLRTHNDKTAPIRSPSHVGCAFSVDRDFFFEIGSYDEGMDIWGSENVELAFRVRKYLKLFRSLFLEREVNSNTLTFQNNLIISNKNRLGLAVWRISGNTSMLSSWSFVQNFNVFI